MLFFQEDLFTTISILMRDLEMPLCCILQVSVYLYFFQAFSKYYRGGFEKKMTRREASLILGVR